MSPLATNAQQGEVGALVPWPQVAEGPVVQEAGSQERLHFSSEGP